MNFALYKTIIFIHDSDIQKAISTRDLNVRIASSGNAP